MRPFAPRPIRFREILAHEGWRLKRYAISVGGAAGAARADVAIPDWPEFADGRALALAALPVPARTAERPGVGFLVEHRGAGADYLVIGWWDRENELPVRVLVREHAPGAAWRPAHASESFCVWDLQVIGFERDAYVASVLASDAGPGAVDVYLARRLEVNAATTSLPPKDALLVVDMQQGLLHGDPKHQLPAVIERINRLAARIRQRGGSVIFIQHAGPPGDLFEPHAPGWQLLSGLQVSPADRLVSKTLNDPFFQTSLFSELAELAPTRVLVSGWATDLCVDACVRSAAAAGHRVIAVADCHTVSDRPHLRAEGVIEHHHWVWSNLIAPGSVTVAREMEIG